MYIDVAFSIPGKTLFTYEMPENHGGNSETAASLVGRRVSAPFGSRKRNGIIVHIHTNSEPDLPKEKIRQIHTVLDEYPLFSDEIMQLGQWLAGFYLASFGECLACMAPSMTTKRPRTLERTPQKECIPLQLTADQTKVLHRLMEQKAGYFYLFGITGSGKTEVYLQFAEHVIRQKKTVLYLVPEIALSYQLENILLPRFSHRYAVIHSHLTGAERLAEWKRIQRDEVDIVIGTRSAVFAPLKNIGLIVLDEEQDSSYKSGSTPRYHARQVAMHRAQESQATLLMGSATPSIESWYHMQRGMIQKLVLPHRIGSARLPQIRIINMHFEEQPFSHDLKQLLQENLSAKKQSILFINRRGFAHVFTCKTCSSTLQCDHCSIPLVYHKDTRTMLCHYCGYTCPAPQSCPHCSSLDIRYQNFGSQHIEEELKKQFPQARIARLDSDTTRVRGTALAVLNRFRSGEIDVLFGTQMISKGLDFPNVKLVAIISADIGLNMPDFRASERSFAQIVQVSGRAGRNSPDGVVIVQTYRANDYAIQHAVSHAYDAFYAQEIELRKELEFPPFSRLIRIVFRGRDEQRVRTTAKTVAEILPQASGIDILGPTFCPIAKLAGNYRMHIILLSKNFRALHEYVQNHWDILHKDRSIYAEVDVDPVHIA